MLQVVQQESPVLMVHDRLGHENESSMLMMMIVVVRFVDLYLWPLLLMVDMDMD